MCVFGEFVIGSDFFDEMICRGEVFGDCGESVLHGAGGFEAELWAGS